MTKTNKVEITAQDIYSVKAAINGGADRIELCTALGVAGLTPSIGLITKAVEVANSYQKEGFVDVLIRPREGDFIYDEDEIQTCLEDIRFAKEAKVNGVVVGVLNADNTINVEALERMAKEAEGVELVFNRAFDVVENQFEALEALIKCGVKRVLTSGAAPRTIEGINRISELVNQASGRIEIMAGGGVRIVDIEELFEVGVDAIHISARKSVKRGPNRPGERAEFLQADVELVKLAVNAAKV